MLEFTPMTSGFSNCLIAIAGNTISSTSGSMNNVSMNIGSQLSGDVIDQEDYDQS